ncbi:MULTISPECIES: putative bifunctional diguanylate cyclase/phosphodiesterase [unclassified Rhizobium]|uniref:putative bifunctional diguanylate cyclase/phosphodiesterase n=1 Tax=Rhizobium sp. BG4 TaxID=2613770 RepID=UPI00193DD598|nr:EAL domain-containing protein [Rhizobium sp. BG4]QRM44165.1 EAL domain-containing protein [Rhizobium sp. BG4]
MKPHNPNRVPKDVYLSFVSSLFGNRMTLVAGVIVHVVAFVAVAAKADAPLYYLLALAFLLTFVGRMLTFRQFDKVEKQSLTRADIERWETFYVIGATSTAAILGIGSGYAIFILRDPFAELACIAVTMASMVSVVGRNYGSQRAIDLQTLACCLPMIVCSLMALDFYRAILSAFLIPFGLTTRAMANGVREFLYENVIAHRQISLIADRFDTALNNMPHGLVMVDPGNRIQVINRKACELLKIGDPDRLKDRDLGAVLRYGARYSFVDASQPDLILRQLSQVAEGSMSRVLIHLPEDLSLEFSAKRRIDGGAVLIFEDVSSRVKAEQKILHMVRFDALSGLPNREYFGQLVQDYLNRHPRRKGPLGFMVIDIDEFKHVNDMRGHITGDKLLCAIAERVKEKAGSAIVGRLMGDQFVIFFPHAKNREALEAEIRTVHADIQGHYEADEVTFLISLSAGYAVLEGNAFAMDEWSIKADLALFESKSRGRGGIAGFEREMDGRYVEQQKLKADLRDAVAAGALNAVYQPMYRADGSRIDCAEALARWVHPERGSIPPDVFIRLAEEMGIISDITRFILVQACSDCMTWPEHIAVSVNLSARDLRDNDILLLVSEALAKTGLPASRLHLEITESCLIDEPAAVRTILAELRSRGITIAIDDFGTGFSSLSYLDTLPLDIVKIDRSFVRNIAQDTRRLKLLRGTVNLARELGLKIVIEGVETTDQLAIINKERSADLIQGYVFSPPVPSQNIGILSGNLRPASRRKAGAA